MLQVIIIVCEKCYMLMQCYKNVAKCNIKCYSIPKVCAKNVTQSNDVTKMLHNVTKNVTSYHYCVQKMLHTWAMSQ